MEKNNIYKKNDFYTYHDREQRETRLVSFKNKIIQKTFPTLGKLCFCNLNFGQCDVIFVVCLI